TSEETLSRTWSPFVYEIVLIPPSGWPLTTLIVRTAGSAGVLVDVEAVVRVDVAVDVEALAPVSVEALVLVLCVAVVCASEDDESPLSSPPRRTTKTMSRTAKAPRMTPVRWTPDSPRPGSSPPAFGGVSGVLMRPQRVRGGPEARPACVREVTATARRTCSSRC